MSMDAIVVEKSGGPDVLKVKKVDIPKPGKNEILIRIKAAGVNPVDIYIRESAPENYGVTLPYIPGYDAAGVVEAVGEGVTRFKKGDRVFTSCHAAKGSGCYAQYGVFRESGVFELPENVDFTSGAAVGVPHFTAYQALVLVGKVKPTDTVLIHGASGAVGQACVQILRGLKVKNIIGTAGTDQGLELVKQLGATHVFNHRDKNEVELVRKALGGQQINLIVEMSANNNFAKDLDLIGNLGKIVLVGGGGEIKCEPAKMLHTQCTVTGIILLKASDDEWKTMGKAIVEGLKTNVYTLRIAQTFPLNAANKAHEEQEKSVKGSGTTGNFVIVVD